MSDFQRGDAVRSTADFERQFPIPIKRNGGRPLVGRFRRYDKNGNLVVKWAQQVTEMHLAECFVERSDDK